MQIPDLDNRNSQNPSQNSYKERLKLGAEYKMLSSHSIEYLLLKNQSDTYEHGDKAGEILARQLNCARAKQIINGVATRDGGSVTDQQGINDAFQRYYYDLYSSDNTSDSPLLSDFF